MRGARAVQQAVVQGFPQADIGIGIVWINMLPADNALAARLQSLRMSDPRIRHFHDPHRRAGRAIAQALGAPGQVAWDIYLFFSPGGEWGETPPAPIRWAHQLGDSWADPACYHTGGDLVAELARAMGELTTSAGNTA